MDIITQVDNLTRDMNALLEDLYNTDSENIDFNQLKVLSQFSRNYSIDVQEFINRRKERLM